MEEYKDIEAKLQAVEEIANKSPQKNTPNESKELKTVTCLGLFLTGFSYLGLLLISLGVVLGLEAFNLEKPLYTMLANNLSYIILFICLIAFCATDWKKFIAKLKGGKKWAFGFLCGIGTIILEIIVASIVAIFYQGGENANQSAVNDMVKNYPTFSIIVLCFIGPFCEELTYRVGLYGLLRKKSRILAIIIETIIFAGMHLSFIDADIMAELASLPIYLAISLGLTLTYEKFDLPGSYVAHVMLNLMSMISILLV